jgi:hypothetical protein
MRPRRAPSRRRHRHGHPRRRGGPIQGVARPLPLEVAIRDLDSRVRTVRIRRPGGSTVEHDLVAAAAGRDEQPIRPRTGYGHIQQATQARARHHSRRGGRARLPSEQQSRPAAACRRARRDRQYPPPAARSGRPIPGRSAGSAALIAQSACPADPGGRLASPSFTGQMRRPDRQRRRSRGRVRPTTGGQLTTRQTPAQARGTRRAGQCGTGRRPAGTGASRGPGRRPPRARQPEPAGNPHRLRFLQAWDVLQPGGYPIRRAHSRPGGVSLIRSAHLPDAGHCRRYAPQDRRQGTGTVRHTGPRFTDVPLIVFAAFVGGNRQ